MYGPEPVRHGRRDRGLFPAYLLKENVVWDIEFQPRSHYTDSAGGASEPGPSDVQLVWEELVTDPATLEKIKKSLPKAVCAPDYTHLDAQRNEGAETSYNITALTYS